MEIGWGNEQEEGINLICCRCSKYVDLSEFGPITWEDLLADRCLLSTPCDLCGMPIGRSTMRLVKK